MSNARTEMLAGIRRALGVSGDEAPRRAVVADRLARHPAGIVPARGHLAPSERRALFRRQAEQVQATVENVADRADIPDAVARYLRDANLPAAVRRGADPRLAGLPWGQTTLLVSEGPSDGHDLAGLSHATAGIAETGTLALLSGPDNPTTLNFLPDHHIVVLDAGDIVADLETVWECVRAAHPDLLPRTVNLVTGPSRSADIEQTLLLGAHGPRRLHILVVGASE